MTRELAAFPIRITPETPPLTTPEGTADGKSRRATTTLEANGVDPSQRIDPEITPRRISDLIARIKESADKLAHDQTSRGDLKILSRTLRELRYAFKVFSPYRTTAR